MKNFSKNKHFLLIVATVLFVIAQTLSLYFNNGYNSTIRHFQKTLQKKEVILNAEMVKLANRAKTDSYDQLFKHFPSYYNSLMEKEGIALLIYESDTLKFWSDNSIAVENWIKEVCLDTHMAKLHNGWFEVMRPPTNSSSTKTIVGLILIKNEFPYQNKYLTNEFQKNFSVPAETKLLIDTPASKTSVKNLNGEYLLSLKFNSPNVSNSYISYLSCILNTLLLFLIVLYLKVRSIELRSRLGKNGSFALFFFLIAIARYLSIQFQFPEIYYTFDLFHPSVYADASSIWLSSLGDLFINILLLFYLSFDFYTEYDIHSVFNKISDRFKYFFTFLLFLFYFWFSWMITTLFVGLIKNSSISFTINNIFTLTIYSYVSIVIIALLLFVYFLFSDKLVTAVQQFSLNRNKVIFLLLSSVLIHSLICHIVGSRDLILIFWPLLILILIGYIKRRLPIYPFSGVIFLVFLFSLYATHVVVKYAGKKEQESRKIYAEKVAAEKDPIAELLFEDLEKEIIKDTVLSSMLNAEKTTLEFEKRLRQQYFSGFWEKYDVHVALFDSMCVPVIKSQNQTFDNNLYFDELIAKRGSKTTSKHFYSLNNPSGKIEYIAKLPFRKTDKEKFGTLYIELDGKFISDEIGFPELLLDRNIGFSQELVNYSYAKYKNNLLISQYGKFSYALTENYSGSQKEIFESHKEDGFDHLLYRPDANTLIILSKKDEGIIGQITTFSYLFAFFSLLLLSILFFRQLSMSTLLDGFSLKYRIQVLLVLIVLTSLALFGGGTIYYIKQQFEIKNRENLSEKIHSVLMETENRLETENHLTPDLAEYASFIMRKLSSVFFTDINLYDVSGNLYASSRPKVFDEGLTSKKMNPEAYLQIAILGKTEFVHDERIGNLNYLSAYIPLKNKNGELLAYLNLPYFAKQNELEKEISGFLVALINIYVLLFALSIVTAIFISNYVTKPLKLIQDKLRNIKLGKTNELIEWKENDEIGSLVNEYNRMIVELSHSADLLAKSERKSAWREMAKQVAHEIKNPLTPMKLSIQHLQRTWKDNAPDMDQQMERVTKTIIEQIDTLSTIATEFSNFAKMPKANFEKINLHDVLVNSISLYRNLDYIQLEFKEETTTSAEAWADKEQLLRVFNNLIKNATQSIPENKKGFILITLKREQNDLLVLITDNGIGIPEDSITKIFTPNFTTKNGGMGLGLAMVKNIIENTGGRIWFETKVNKGTTFFISIPAYKNQE